MSNSLPTHLPMTVDHLIDELNILNPPIILDAPVYDKDLIQLSYLIGRRSVVQELNRIREGIKNDEL